MTSGGARAQSGPPADPNSRESARRGLTFKLLPRDGYTGAIPEFPLPEVTTRELAVWGELWRTPQAAMWAAQKWQIRNVALYCRTSVRCEAFDAPGNVFTNLHRLGDQLGLTPAGLAFNGWRLDVAPTADDEAVPAPAGEPVEGSNVTRMRPERRMRGES